MEGMYFKKGEIQVQVYLFCWTSGVRLVPGKVSRIYNSCSYKNFVKETYKDWTDFVPYPITPPVVQVYMDYVDDSDSQEV